MLYCMVTSGWPHVHQEGHHHQQVVWQEHVQGVGGKCDLLKCTLRGVRSEVLGIGVRCKVCHTVCHDLRRGVQLAQTRLQGCLVLHLGYILMRSFKEGGHQ
jgi:hypothetical protein